MKRFHAFLLLAAAFLFSFPFAPAALGFPDPGAGSPSAQAVAAAGRVSLETSRRGEEAAPGWVLASCREIEPGIFGGKLVREEDGLQIPVILDEARLEAYRRSGRPAPEGKGWLVLGEAALSVSVPSCPAPGLISYVCGTRLTLLAGEEPLRRIVVDLGCAAPDTAVAPGLDRAAFCDFEESAIRVADLCAGRLDTVMEGFEGTLAWSPGGAWLAVVSMDGRIRLVRDPGRPGGGGMVELFFPPAGRGAVQLGAPFWSPRPETGDAARRPCTGAGARPAPRGSGERPAAPEARPRACRLVVPVRVGSGTGVLASGLLCIDPGLAAATSSAAATGLELIDLRDALFGGGVAGVRFEPGPWPEAAGRRPPAGLRLALPARLLSARGSGRRSTELSGVPYINQIYDTPDWFDGNWACGPASCVMAVQKFNRLPFWLCRASWPSSHVSLYGDFVSGQFTENGRTFSWVSYDPSGRPARGAYGYICPGGSAYWDRMKNFVEYAGCTAHYDTSPTWSELKSQIDAGRPVVLSTSLTSAGHIIVAMGYNSDHSVIVRDPYGDKALGYPNDEPRAVYDWPGYNNGNPNLGSVGLAIGVSAAQAKLELIVDDGTAGVPRCTFEKFGPSQYWWESDEYGTGSPGGAHAGTNGMLYTYSEPSGSWTNWVQWGFKINKAGFFKLEVFVPRNLATTTNALYYHYHSQTGLSFLKAVDQNSHYDEWVTLSPSFYCRAGWNSIRLGDVTGESSPAMIGVDAVRISKP